MVKGKKGILNESVRRFFAANDDLEQFFARGMVIWPRSSAISWNVALHVFIFGVFACTESWFANETGVVNDMRYRHHIL